MLHIVLQDPVLCFLQRGKTLVTVGEQAEPHLYDPLTLQVRIVVWAGEVSQNGYQGAIHQHHVSLFVERADCDPNGLERDFHGLHSLPEPPVDKAENKRQDRTSAGTGDCLAYEMHEGIARIEAT